MLIWRGRRIFLASPRQLPGRSTVSRFALLRRGNQGDGYRKFIREIRGFSSIDKELLAFHAEIIVIINQRCNPVSPTYVRSPKNENPNCFLSAQSRLASRLFDNHPNYFGKSDQGTEDGGEVREHRKRRRASAARGRPG